MALEIRSSINTPNIIGDDVSTVAVIDISSQIDALGFGQPSDFLRVGGSPQFSFSSSSSSLAVTSVSLSLSGKRTLLTVNFNEPVPHFDPSTFGGFSLTVYFVFSL